MTKYLTLVFNEDVQREEIEQLKNVPGCTGVATYKNTVNLYFKRLDRPVLRRLAIELQRQLVYTGADVQLQHSTINGAASRQNIYEALREEAES
jgi:hypothetical protein